MKIFNKDIKAVFFDWDGTLIDNFNFFEQAHNHVIKSLGLTQRQEGWFKECFGKPRELILNDLYGRNKEEAAKLFYEFITEHHLKYIRPFDDAEPFLKRLKDENIYLGVISNKKRSFIQAELDYLNWGSYFTVIVASGDVERDKPFADPLLFSISKLPEQIPLQSVVYVGDTENDEICAEKAGVNFIVITHGSPLHNPMRHNDDRFEITLNNFESFFHF